MVLERRAMLGYGAIALVALAGACLLIAATDPSEQDGRAFVQKLLLSGGLYARGTDEEVVPLAAADIAQIADAGCRPDPDAAGHGRRWPPVSRSFLRRYAVVRSDGAPFEVMPRAVRQSGGEPAGAPSPSPLVDPARYRVGGFRVVPIGRRDAERLLGTPVPRGRGASVTFARADTSPNPPSHRPPSALHSLPAGSSLPVRGTHPSGLKHS